MIPTPQQVVIKYIVAFKKPNGDWLGNFNGYNKISWSRAENNVTDMVIEVGLEQFVGYSHWLTPDNRIALWRSVNDGEYQTIGNTEWLIRTISISRGQDGDGAITNTLSIRAATVNCILGGYEYGRIVAFKATTLQADKSGEIDSIAKTVVGDNFGSGATDYTLTSNRDMSAYLDIQPAHVGATPAISMEFSMRQVRQVLDDLAAKCAEANIVWLYDVVPQPGGHFKFETYIGAQGRDRNMIFSFSHGNVLGMEYGQSWAPEANVIYAGGDGTETARKVALAEDTTRSRRSPFSRAEVFINESSSKTQNSLNSLAQSRLESGRPDVRVKINIAQAPGAVMGVDWEFGDVVRWSDALTGYSGSGRVAGIDVVFENNTERVTAYITDKLPFDVTARILDESKTGA